jgi:hypothetical protein
MPPQAQFTHRLLRTIDRLMIESTCSRCGSARLVSDHDGSLAEWEEGHTCSDDQSDSRPNTKRKDDNIS